MKCGYYLGKTSLFIFLFILIYGYISIAVFVKNTYKIKSALSKPFSRFLGKGI